MYSYTTVALAAASFVTFFQPCPAPPIGMAALGEAATGGAVAGTVGNVLSNAESGGSKKRDDSGAAAGIMHCVSQASEQPPTMAPGDGTSIIVNNVPQSCLAEVQAYNAHPHNGAMAALHGTTTQINSTAVRLDGMPHQVLGKISDMIKATPHQQSQRRSMRFEKY